MEPLNSLTPQVNGGGGGDNSPEFELAIISSQYNFYDRMKFLEAQGFPRSRIIDGRVFKVPNFDFPRLINESVAYGLLETNSFKFNTYTIYKQVYRLRSNFPILILGSKSYIEGGLITGNGSITVGIFSSISWDVEFRTGENMSHNHQNISSHMHFDWLFPVEFLPPQGICKINIGNDVWIGRGCILKCTNPNKPLVIGDGAVIASDSVVVKNVPPYAIVGGNPAQIIKYRFPPEIIEALLRIKWWDWSLDKIHDNFKYFNDIEKFVSLHDK
ncbi:MAG: CatB-related O-acetyltransferase [Selenomonadaceae bacterium]|nr:CatB-related O-acetyltransferase [Selenomonadaceae bacterium]